MSDERQSDLAVMDSNEYKNKRRLQGLLDAHDQVEETADRLFEMQAAGKISEDARNIGIQRAVKRFIRESWNLLSNFDSELADDSVPHPFATEIGSVPKQWEKNEAIVGLDGFLLSQEWYHESITQTREARHGPNQQATQRQRHTVPADVSWQAFLLLWEFLDGYKDLDIQFEDIDDSLESWGYDKVDPDAVGVDIATNGDAPDDDSEEEVETVEVPVL